MKPNRVRLATRRPRSAWRLAPESTFCCRDAAALHSLHSRNPYCTAVFCTVPRNQIFSFGIPLGLSSGSVSPESRLSPRMLTFPSQVPDLALFNLFYPRRRSCRQRQHSTSFHPKSPAIPHIPLNSTYDVPLK